MKKKLEPTAASLREMPEIDFSRVKVRGRGRYAHLLSGRTKHMILVDDDLWPYFQSAEAVNAALRSIVEVSRHLKKAG